MLANRLLGDIEIRHRHHRIEAVERIARAVGVDRRKTAVVASVHGLQHVEGLFTAHLADHDAVGAHAQRVDHELALLHGALAFDVGRPCLEPHHVPLPQHELGGVFDGDDALAIGDEAREHVQEGGLAGARAARHDHVQPRTDAAAQEVDHGLGERLPLHQVARAELVGSEAADREHRAVERKRGNDGVDARAIGQAGVDHRTRFVDAPAHRAHDPLDDAEQVLIVLEDERGWLELPLAFDVHLIVPVDQDVRYRGVAEQRLERAKAEELVEHVGHERFALRHAERSGGRLRVQEGGNEAADLGLRLLTADAVQPVEVQPVEQGAVQALLGLLIVRLAHVHGAGRHHSFGNRHILSDLG